VSTAIWINKGRLGSPEG